MKLLVVLTSVVLAVSAATDNELWSEFKKNHDRDYRNLREEQLRFSVFQQNLRKIEEHNEKYAKGEKSYYLGVTRFADYTEQEFRSMLNYSRSSKSQLTTGAHHIISGVELSSEVNWVSEGAVVEVKNQGNCGSCWAFSATGSLEGQLAIRKGQRISLSEQNLVDCSNLYGNGGCDGGEMEAAFAYVKDYGIESEADYPYIGQEDYCTFSRSLSVLEVSGWVSVRSGDEYALQDAVATVGPISIAVNADNYALYAGGIFDEGCSDELNHGVLAVGYGSDYSADYWLVKNSWGASWGENGYIRMVRNQYNQCGVASDASYPILA